MTSALHASFQQQASERGNGQREAVIEPVCGDRLRRDAAAIADVAAAEDARVAVEELDVVARPWHADAIRQAWHRGEIEDADDVVVRVAREADQRDNAVLVVVAIDPPEAGRREILLVQRRLSSIVPI